MLYGFCLDKGTHYWRAITLRKPAVRAVGQAPSGWETRGERVSVVKFPFRHLSLAGFVTREFCVFSHFHFPPGRRRRPSCKPLLERQQGRLRFGFLGLQFPEC